MKVLVVSSLNSLISVLEIQWSLMTGNREAPTRQVKKPLPNVHNASAGSYERRVLRRGRGLFGGVAAQCWVCSASAARSLVISMEE